MPCALCPGDLRFVLAAPSFLSSTDAEQDDHENKNIYFYGTWTYFIIIFIKIKVRLAEEPPEKRFSTQDTLKNGQPMQLRYSSYDFPRGTTVSKRASGR